MIIRFYDTEGIEQIRAVETVWIEADAKDDEHLKVELRDTEAVEITTSRTMRILPESHKTVLIEIK